MRLGSFILADSVKIGLFHRFTDTADLNNRVSKQQNPFPLITKLSTILNPVRQGVISHERLNESPAVAT